NLSQRGSLSTAVYGSWKGFEPPIEDRGLQTLPFFSFYSSSVLPSPVGHMAPPNRASSPIGAAGVGGAAGGMGRSPLPSEGGEPAPSSPVRSADSNSGNDRSRTRSFSEAKASNAEGWIRTSDSWIDLNPVPAGIKWPRITFSFR